MGSLMSLGKHFPILQVNGLMSKRTPSCEMGGLERSFHRWRPDLHLYKWLLGPADLTVAVTGPYPHIPQMFPLGTPVSLGPESIQGSGDQPRICLRTWSLPPTARKDPTSILPIVQLFSPPQRLCPALVIVSSLGSSYL